MLSLVTAAEYQFHFDSAQLDRDIALRRSIREHEASRAQRTGDPGRMSAAPAPAAPVGRTRRREAWARPIGLQLDRVAPCPAT